MNKLLLELNSNLNLFISGIINGLILKISLFNLLNNVFTTKPCLSSYL